MPSKGKHESGTTGAFYRDLIIMIVGILLVGAAVFLILFLVSDGPDPDPEPTTSPVATSTTTSVATTTSTTVATTTTTSTVSTTTTVPVRPASEVRVVVLNSMGLDGAAGRMTDRLGEAGYQTLAPDDFEPEQDPSRIWFREGFSAEAAELSELIEGSVVEPLPDEDVAEGADIVMVLGTGYEE